MQSKEPQLGEGEDFNPPYPTEQPEKKVNKIPPADLAPSRKQWRDRAARSDTHIKVRFPGKNFNRQIRGSD